MKANALCSRFCRTIAEPPGSAGFRHKTSLRRRLPQFVFVMAMLQTSVSAQIVAQPVNETEPETELRLAVRAVSALRRMHDDVIVYRSLTDFEANGRIARVSYEDFEKTLKEVSEEVETILNRLPQSRLKTEINNALYSYRDGAFWWGKLHPARVVRVSAMTFAPTNSAPTERVFMSTVPYTVAIHWKQGGTYLKRAEKLTNEKTQLQKVDDREMTATTKSGR
jgi:hypothetical protein